MPNQERTFEAGGKTYTIRFTQNALYRLEKELGGPLFTVLQSLGVVEVQAMMWAGLEGARLKGRAIYGSADEAADQARRARRFTIDEAGEIIDELGGAAAAAPIIVDAWRAAMPRRNREAAADRGDRDPT